MSKLIDRQCPICGQLYQADIARLRHGRQTTCSRECSYKLRAQELKTSVELTCPVCGKKFERTPAQIERTKYANVCSRRCLYKGRSLGIIKREVNEPYQLTEEGRQSLEEAGKRRRGKLRKPPIKFTCETCGKEVSIPRGEVSPARQFRFCSHKCANVAIRGEGNPAWRGGYAPYYGPNWGEQRRRARKRDGYTCQECGVTENELGQELDVHHIVRFASFESYKQANVLSNLVSFCHSCHMSREWQDNPTAR